jgi:hypothetical protein
LLMKSHSMCLFLALQGTDVVVLAHMQAGGSFGARPSS